MKATNLFYKKYNFEHIYFRIENTDMKNEKQSRTTWQILNISGKLPIMLMWCYFHEWQSLNQFQQVLWEMIPLILKYLGNYNGTK